MPYRVFLVVLILLSWLSSVCQTSFVIVPTINFKNSISYADPLSYNKKSNGFFESQYLYTPYGISFSDKFIRHSSFCYGISIGGSFKNKTRLLTLNYNNDAAHFNASSYFRPLNSEYHFGSEMKYFGVKLNRFAILYSHQLKTHHKILNLWLIAGIGIYANTNTFTDIFPTNWNVILNQEGDKVERTYLQPYVERRMNCFFKIGMEFDLKFRNIYVCTFGSSFVQGVNLISKVDYVHEYLIDGEEVIHRTGLMSRGSGFYFEFSRRFHVFSNKKNIEKITE